MFYILLSGWPDLPQWENTLAPPHTPFFGGDFFNPVRKSSIYSESFVFPVTHFVRRYVGR